MNLKNKPSWLAAFFIVVGFATSHAKADMCYQVSKLPELWSKTPELLCVKSDPAHKALYEISLKVGMPSPRTVATFHYDLISRARCLDCNKDVFGIQAVRNSSFSGLEIKFDGKVGHQPYHEKGTVMVGGTKLYYRTLKSGRN